MALNGFDTLTTQAVADLANVGTGTYFRHFANKRAGLLAAFAYATDQLTGLELPDPPETTLYERFQSLWLRTARNATKHPKAFEYWRLFRATPQDHTWSAPKSLQLGPFRRVPHMILECVGTRHYRHFDAWQMAAQWTATVQYILSLYPANPTEPYDPEDGPTPRQTLDRAFEAWWESLRILKEAPAIWQRREEE